jgi:3-hydroxyisobutyrate dehydrogenase-like beta-hydroxyacid dehydrogenase
MRDAAAAVPRAARRAARDLSAGPCTPRCPLAARRAGIEDIHDPPRPEARPARRVDPETRRDGPRAGRVDVLRRRPARRPRVRAAAAGRGAAVKVAFLGIGRMGFPMARRLCEAGHEVRAWNRTPDKAARLAPFGATVRDTARAAVADADVVVGMLEDGAVTGEVLFAPGSGAAHAMAPGTLVVDMASIRPREACEHAARLAATGVSHVDAPVSGGTGGAEAGTLAIMAGGDPPDFARAQPLLSALGRATLVGPHGAGQLAKLANQMIVGITIGAVAEALLLCERGGADPAKVKEAIAGGFADSRILQVHGQRMIERDFEPRARMSVQLKDLRNALATAAETGLDVPITSLLASLYAAGVGRGLVDLDHAGLFVELAARNGLT